MLPKPRQLALLRLTLILIAGMLFSCSCEEEIEGPDTLELEVNPSLVCGEQLTTRITVRGTELSPQPFSGLALPELWLRRTHTIDGQARDEEPFQLDPDEELGSVQWISESEMIFEVSPETALQPGLYDLLVYDADGQASSMTAGLTVIPRPTLDSLSPGMACGQQHDSTLVITGSFFLVFEDERPTVTVGSVDLTPTELSGCFDLPGPADARACSELTVGVRANSLPTSIVEVTVTNPAPASCFSTEPAPLEIVPSPSVVSIEPALACVAQSERTFVISGSDFLEIQINGADSSPTIMIGDSEAELLDIDGCSSLAGPVNGRRCNELTVSLAAESLQPGVHDVAVTNPEPADCGSSDTIEVQVIGAPIVSSVSPSGMVIPRPASPCPACS